MMVSNRTDNETARGTAPNKHRGELASSHIGVSEASDARRLQLVLSASPSEAEAIIRFFERIAAEEAWITDGELRSHIARSTYFGLWEPLVSGSNPPNLSQQGQAERVVAGLQLVVLGPNGILPSHRVWPELFLADPNRSAHIAMLAVAPEWRGKEGGLFWILTAAMWNHCVRNGIRNLYLEATPRTMRCYQRLGWPLQVQGELRQHWGEPCFPCSLSVREVAGALAERAVRSHAYQNILADMIGMNK